MVFRRKNLNVSFYKSYVSSPVNKTHSILGAGQGSGSTIYNQLKCKGRDALVEDPKNYNFHGYETNPTKESLNFLLANLSNKKRIKLSILKNELEKNFFNQAMETLRELEKKDLASINDDVVDFNFENAKEKFLYSLFFCQEEKIINLAYSRIEDCENNDDLNNVSKNKIISSFKPLSRNDSNKIFNLNNEKNGKRLEGSIVKIENDTIMINREKEERLVLNYDVENIMVVEEFIDVNNNYKSFLKTKRSIEDLKEGDNCNFVIDEDSQKLFFIRKITGAE